MARRILLTLLTAAAAPAAWWLHARQLSTAYDLIGLPLPVSVQGQTLWGLLAALALLTLLLSLPEKAGRSLAELRGVAPGAVFQGAGALLLAAGGAWQLYELRPILLSSDAIGAAAALLAALGLFGGLWACLGGESRAGSLLLLPMCAAALQLALSYRAHAADPVTLRYALRCLALAAATLAAAALAGLAFGAGGRRRALLFCALTPALSAAALCTADGYGEALALTGCALASFGFFLSLLFGISHKKHPVYELVDDPFRTGSVPVPKDALAKKPAPTAEAAVSTPPAPVKKPVTAPPARPAAEAPAPSPVPKEDDFDLARVDRLLRELGVEDSEI